MNDKIIKQTRLVHELFLRSQYDRSNKAKLAAYRKAQQDLIHMQYAGAK